ncbi:MAG: serine hydrolase family protein [Alphaproteobacteria bacterium]|nr:serine hydrolase family protein [Alphaproteobacteria bacterium]
MKSSEVEILVVPGYEGSGPEHWQTKLAQKLSSARVIVQMDWSYGNLARAVQHVVDEVNASAKPVVFVAHSAGCPLVAHSVHALREKGLLGKIAGAYLVCPPSAEAMRPLNGIDPDFVNFPRVALPFPSLIVGSSTDPFSTVEVTAALVKDWGSDFSDAGPMGHINSDSGHGPWPEGIMRFAGFLSKLKMPSA